MLVDGNDLSGGAVYAKKPSTLEAILLLHEPEYNKFSNEQRCDGVSAAGNELRIGPVARWFWDDEWKLRNHYMGQVDDPQNGKSLWRSYNSSEEYYSAIVEKRY